MVIKNIKGFDETDLNFGPEDQFAGWSVMTGENGSGKTALLKAISLALLGPDQSRSLVPDLRGWVTESHTTGTISVEIKLDHEIDKAENGDYLVRSTFWAEVEISRHGPLFTISSANIFQNRERSAGNGPWAPSTQGWFAVGYGPF